MKIQNNLLYSYLTPIKSLKRKIRQGKVSGQYLPHSGCYESAVVLRGYTLAVECRRSRVARFILLGRHPLPPRLQAAHCIQPLCKQISLALLSFNYLLKPPITKDFIFQITSPLSQLPIDPPFSTTTLQATNVISRPQ